MLQLAREQGTAFIMVTHDESLAARCSRRFRLVEGRLSAWVSPTAEGKSVPIDTLDALLAAGPRLAADDHESMLADTRRIR